MDHIWDHIWIIYETIHENIYEYAVFKNNSIKFVFIVKIMELKKMVRKKLTLILESFNLKTISENG